MAAKISIEGEDRSFECKQIVTIGRARSNDIVLVNPAMSRNHAIIRLLGDGRYYLMDTGSANGSSVNDKRVFTPSVLKDGDSIGLGGHKLIFKYVPADAGGRGDGEKLNDAPTIQLDPIPQELTVFVTDIRGYTAMSEKISDDTLAMVLGGWFGEVNEIVEANGGMIDKFIGDAAMAIWLTGEGNAVDTVRSALRTASALCRSARAINDRFPDLPTPLRIGVGINTGEAVLGNVGVAGTRGYTAIGDTVTMAFHLESATKTLNTDVVLGEDAYTCLPADTVGDHLCSVKVKGKAQPVPVCAMTFARLEELDIAAEQRE